MPTLPHPARLDRLQRACDRFLVDCLPAALASRVRMAVAHGATVEELYGIYARVLPRVTCPGMAALTLAGVEALAERCVAEREAGRN